jgi:hypothetical protein
MQVQQKNPRLSIKAGFPAYGSSSEPRLPLPVTSKKSGNVAAFVPDHGNGWHAMDSHHLSFYLEP